MKKLIMVSKIFLLIALGINLWAFIATDSLKAGLWVIIILITAKNVGDFGI